MNKIDTLPNFFNGKLYPRWERVRSLCSDGSLIASRTNKQGEAIQLFLSENGNKRELYSSNGKIMDVLDNQGVKRVYQYSRVDDNTVKGQMIASPDKDGRFPLILAAKWILKSMTPEKLVMKINKEHPQSQIFLPKEGPDGTPVYTGTSSKLQIEEILAKDFVFENSILPKTILLKTTKGEIKPVVSKQGEVNLKVAQHFGIESSELGQNLITVV